MQSADGATACSAIGAARTSDIGSIAALAAPVLADLAATTAIPSGPVPFQYNYYKTLSGDLTLTDSGSSVEGNGYSIVLIGDASPRTITFPSSYSEAQGTNITSFIVAANAQYTIYRKYVNGGWRIYGDPAPSSATWATGILFTYGATSPQITNSTAETTVFSGTIPATTLNNYGAVEFRLAGSITQTTGSAQQLTVKIKYGGTTLYEDALSAGYIPSSGTSRGFKIIGTLFGTAAADAQLVEAMLFIGPADAATTGQSGIGGNALACNSEMIGTGTVDTDTDQTFSITVTLSAASSAYNWQTTRGVANKL